MDATEFTIIRQSLERFDQFIAAEALKLIGKDMSRINGLNHKLALVLEAMLVFHAGGPFTHEMHFKWTCITREILGPGDQPWECTTRVLCDMARKVLALVNEKQP